MYDYKRFGSTPRCAIPDLREYSHKSGIVPLGVLPDPLKLCTGSGHDMICRSVIILPLDTMGALPETKNHYTGSTILVRVPRWLIRPLLVTAGVDPEPNRKS